MGTSSCCSVPPEKENKPPVIQESTIRITEQEQKEDSKSDGESLVLSENEEEEEKKKKSKSEIEPLGLSKNEVNEMMDELQLFLSFLQSRAAIKETIGQGGQGKIRKYYSNKYQREVVEKIVNLNNCTRGTLGGNSKFNKRSIITSRVWSS